MAKNQANAEQHPEAELFLYENYSYSSSKLSSKNNKIFIKKAKNQVCLYLRDYMKMKMENGSHRYGINRPYLDMDTNIVNVKSVSV